MWSTAHFQTVWDRFDNWWAEILNQVGEYISFPFYFRFFWCGPFLKSLLNLLRYCFSLFFFYDVLAFWLRGMWEFSFMTRDWTAIPPQPAALEAKVLATEPPGLTPPCFFLYLFCIFECVHNSKLGEIEQA